MTGRICILGDSHIGALKLALNESKDSHFDDLVDIYGTRETTWNAVYVSDGKLVSDDPSVREMFQFTGGQESIDLSQYQSFCIVGGVSTRIVRRLSRTIATHSMNLPQRLLVSRGMFVSLLETRLRDSMAVRLMQMLASVTDKPIYRLASPLISEAVLDRRMGRMLQEIRNVGAEDEIMDTFDHACEKIFAGRTRLIPQPELTRSGRLFTKRNYCTGSKRLTIEDADHPEKDFEHMNAEYGLEVLRQMAAIPGIRGIVPA
jgi:hypothetical protein